MTRFVHVSRRATLSLLGAAAAFPLLPGRAAAQTIGTLALHGPPAGPSITLAHAVATGQFSGIAETTTFSVWRNPDELRAGLTSGQIALSVVPVQAAANLYNRGFPIRLANTMTDGLYYILAEDAAITSIADLAGRHIAVPFRGDTPEIVLGQLLAHHGLDAATDLQITYAGTPTEAMQLMLAGRVEAALTSEPGTTAGVLRARQDGRELRRAIDVQAAWGEMTGAAPILPQAGLAVMQAFLDDHGAALPALLAALEGATADVLANPETAAAHAAEVLGMPAPVLAAAIPHANLVARRAAGARADVERMLTAMAGPDMARIGGRLPDDGFYL
jgi:NitT/TauT family transport system substrate-binding protein